MTHEYDCFTPQIVTTSNSGYPYDRNPWLEEIQDDEELLAATIQNRLVVWPINGVTRNFRLRYIDVE